MGEFKKTKKNKKICEKDKENSSEVVKTETIEYMSPCALSTCTHMKHKLGREKTKSLSPSSMKEDREENM